MKVLVGHSHSEAERILTMRRVDRVFVVIVLCPEKEKAKFRILKHLFWTPQRCFYWGILVKLVICVVPGHWKIKILNLKKKNKFFCFFMFLYPIQGGKNNGSPYLTNKSWFLANLMSRDNKIKVTLVLWHPRTLFF